MVTDGETVGSSAIRGFAEGDPRNARIAAKRSDLLSAARTLFLESGFAATTMEAVAGEAGVSKMTLYRHFRTKEALFEALVRGLADGMAMPETAANNAAEGPPRDRLHAFGLSFAAALMRPEALALYRMVVAEAPRFPELAALFQETGRRRAQGWIASLLQDARGLRPDEADRRARAFDALVLGDLFQRRLLGLQEMDEDTLRRQVDDAVEHALR